MLHLRMVRTKARDSYSAKLCPLTEFRSCALTFRRRKSLRDKNYTTESPLRVISDRIGPPRHVRFPPPIATAIEFGLSVLSLGKSEGLLVRSSISRTLNYLGQIRGTNQECWTGNDHL